MEPDTKPKMPVAPAPAARKPRRPSPTTPYLLSVASALALSLAFPPAEVSFLAYLALVPLLVMAVRTRSRRHVFLAAYVGGLFFFAANLYWFWPFSVPGCIALILYLGLYWAVFAWGVRRITETTRLPLALAAPVVWVALEYFRGWFLTGLPWLYVAHTQYENLAIIQIADALGAYGVSFLVVATSGLAVDLLARPLFVRERKAADPASGRPRRRLSRVVVASVLGLACAWAATVGYGLWRIGQDARYSGAEHPPSVAVAAIQTNVPQEIKLLARFEDAEKEEEQMLGDQVRLTSEALAAVKAWPLAPDLVVWPETMVPGFQNPEFLEADLRREVEVPGLARMMEADQARFQGYWQTVRGVAREAGAPVLCGANWADVKGVRFLPEGKVTPRMEKANAALLIGPTSGDYIAEHVYTKVHLVPFGEYVPFRRSFPWLYRLLGRMTPYEFEYSLTPGARDQAPFVLRTASGEVRFQAAICYEDAFAYRIRDMVRPREAGRNKAVDFVVNISNDGWFAKDINVLGIRLPTNEYVQHLNLCVFRAVEERVPIVRSVNTGVSAMIASDGRIYAQVADSLGRRRGVEGWCAGRLDLDRRLAPYTRVGDLFAEACTGGAAALAAVVLVAGLRKRKEHKP